MNVKNENSIKGEPVDNSEAHSEVHYQASEIGESQLFHTSVEGEIEANDGPLEIDEEASRKFQLVENVSNSDERQDVLWSGVDDFEEA